MDKTGLKVNTGEILVLSIKPGTLFRYTQNFFGTIIIYNFLPLQRIATLNNPLDDDGSHLGKVNFFPFVFPQQVLANIWIYGDDRQN